MWRVTQEEDAAFHAIFGREARYYTKGEELNGVRASKILFSTMDSDEVAEMLLHLFDWESTSQGDSFWIEAHDHLRRGRFSDHWHNNCLPLFGAYLDLLNSDIPPVEDML